LNIQGYDPNPVIVEQCRDVCGEPYPGYDSKHLEDARLQFEIHNHIAVKVTLGGKTVLLPDLHNLIADLCSLREAQKQLNN
jgi:hypothetical protein